jgi:hypothetical protein
MLSSLRKCIRGGRSAGHAGRQPGRERESGILYIIVEGLMERRTADRAAAEREVHNTRRASDRRCAARAASGLSLSLSTLQSLAGPPQDRTRTALHDARARTRSV